MAGRRLRHRLGEQLIAARRHGKTFHSVLDAKPLICRDANGELFSHAELGGGEATLWDVELPAR
ncbi:GXWXG domain-containing protein [Saccharopolyspora sp. NFXS83]|uniref:GXWXG domain-containing protein n=1 Tax=Saccharopolyspora sp. NFXS83 TaxID=2993560 RepID=UPI00224B8A33|nr:GXWXG domain-containing protein [Saccharopolyspora sp. NFXS83]MCX2732730.1 GXWXG domain-containing protein [Saccharopolyspora sp. NFXS83]